MVGILGTARGTIYCVPGISIAKVLSRSDFGASYVKFDLYKKSFTLVFANKLHAAQYARVLVRQFSVLYAGGENMI